MKTVKKWIKDGHEVIIQAKFNKNGYFPHWAYSENEIKDLVQLEAKIYDNSNLDRLKEVNNYSTDAYEGKFVEVIEERRFRKDITRDLTIHEVYEKQLEKLVDWSNEYIDTRNYNQKITDGLPDSLLDLA